MCSFSKEGEQKDVSLCGFAFANGEVCEERSFASSMSSIKRDVKKKLLPRPESRCFLEIQPTVMRLPWRSVTCAHSDKSPPVS